LLILNFDGLVKNPFSDNFECLMNGMMAIILETKKGRVMLHLPAF